MKKNIYFIFSSQSYLEFFIPLVIESHKRNYRSIFIFRNNYKKYANPYTENNMKKINFFIEKYKIIKQDSNKIDLTKISGIVFLIDGDIFGPPREIALQESLLLKFNKKTTIIFSMTEHMNFWAVYHHYIDNVNYSLFSNINMVKQMNTFNKKTNVGGVNIETNKSYLSNKNLYFGNTKFDNIPDTEFIINKFNLNKNDKYCLFLYPKMRNNFSVENILNIYSHLKKLGFKIIVKSRPKDHKIEEILQGDIFIKSDTYPNESLQLMKISDLCIISSSSANEETVFSKIPCIDLISDLRPWERNQYLLDEKTYVRIENKDWKDIKFENFKKIYQKLEKKNSLYFDEIKTKYLFTHNNTSKKIFDFLKEKHPEYFKNII